MITENEQLRAIIDRIEAQNERIKEETEARKEIYAEAKGTGYDPAIIRQIVKIRAMDPDKRLEQEAVLEMYMQALGLE